MVDSGGKRDMSSHYGILWLKRKKERVLLFPFILLYSTLPRLKTHGRHGIIENLQQENSCKNIDKFMNTLDVLQAVYVQYV